MMETQGAGARPSMQNFDRISGVRSLLTKMKIIGIWQWGRQHANGKGFQHSRRWQFMHRICLHLPVTFAYIVLMWLQVFTSSNMDQAGDVLYMSLTEAALVVKTLNIWRFSMQAFNFLDELAYGAAFELISSEEIELWQRKQKQFETLITVHLIGTFSCVVSIIIGVLLTGGRELPVAYWVPFEWRTNGRNYWIAVAYNVLGMGVTALLNVSLDMIGCYFLFHISLLYQILGLRMFHLDEVAEKHLHSELRKIFTFHRNVKRMSRECETLTSTYVLSQIVLSALILCFIGYRTLQMDSVENIGEFFSMLQFFLLMLFEIFFPCYFGNQISWYSTQLLTQMYSSVWFQFSVPSRKLIYFYLEFVKHPERVRAGNYFDVDLATFTKVMNNAYTFFAVITNIGK